VPGAPAAWRAHGQQAPEGWLARDLLRFRLARGRHRLIQCQPVSIRPRQPERGITQRASARRKAAVEIGLQDGWQRGADCLVHGPSRPRQARGARGSPLDSSQAGETPQQKRDTP